MDLPSWRVGGRGGSRVDGDRRKTRDRKSFVFGPFNVQRGRREGGVVE